MSSPKIVSVPGPPVSVSLPKPPVMRSLPAPPSIVSSSSSPPSSSLPPLPWMFEGPVAMFARTMIFSAASESDERAARVRRDVLDVQEVVVLARAAVVGDGVERERDRRRRRARGSVHSSTLSNPGPPSIDVGRRRVGVAVAVELVVALAAEHRVGALAGLDVVVAVVALELVVARAGLDPVVAVVAEEVAGRVAAADPAACRCRRRRS